MSLHSKNRAWYFDDFSKTRQEQIYFLVGMAASPSFVLCASILSFTFLSFSLMSSSLGIHMELSTIDFLKSSYC